MNKNKQVKIWTRLHPLVGKRVELHPSTDRWMKGDKYGVLTQVQLYAQKFDIMNKWKEVLLAHIKLDKSNKTITLHPSDYEVTG